MLDIFLKKAAYVQYSAQKIMILINGNSGIFFILITGIQKSDMSWLIQFELGEPTSK